MAIPIQEVTTTTSTPPSASESLAERRARLSAQQAASAGASKSAGGVQTQERDPATVAELVARAGDLAALPQVVMQVIHLTGNPNASANGIERIIGSDQALTARILTLANSSYYGLPRRISSIREAVVFLGFKSVRNLAMTVTSFNLFLGKSDEQSLARRDLWKHSLNAGLCGKLIAGAIPNAGISEEVFTAALLHDIGKMLMHQHLSRPFHLALNTAREKRAPFHEVEAEFLPFTHAEVGAALAMHWNLPAVLVEAIGFHHKPGQAAADPKTCAVVTLANDMANLFGDTSQASSPGPDDDALPVNEVAVAVLEIKPDALRRIAGACAAELHAGSALASLM